MKTLARIEKALLTTVMGGGLLAASLVQSAHASIIIIGEQTGPDVVFSYSGTVDLTGLNPPGSGNSGNRIVPAGSFFSSNPLAGDLYLTSISGPLNFGTGPEVFGTASGDAFTFGALADILIVPDGYLSGTDIMGSLAFTGQTFSSLGVDTSRSYVWTLDANDDTITMEFVPEPSTIALLMAGAAAIGAGTRRRSRRLQKL